MPPRRPSRRPLIQVLPAILVLVTSLIILLPADSFAFTYNQLTDPRPMSWVYDAANLLDAKAELEINQIVRRLQPIAEVMVVTVEQAQPEANDFATNLFNYWRIGTRFKQNGILVLVAKSDRRTVIRTGIGMARNLPDSAAKQIIEQEILPNFRQQNYEVGILSGLKAIANFLGAPKFPFNLLNQPSNLASNLGIGNLINFGIILLLFSGSTSALIKLSSQATPILPIDNSDLGNIQQKQKSSLFHCLIWLASFALLYLPWTLVFPFEPIILILLGIIAALMSKLITPLILKQSTYQCQTCGTEIKKLTQIDHLLTPAEKTAKLIKSTEFEVLYCPKCSDSNHRAKVNFRKSRLNSSYLECEICQELTAKESTTVTVNATYDHPGEMSHHQICLCCNHETVWITSIDQLVHAEPSDFGNSYSYSSSDSSYDSGGSSDGGGASGDW